MPEQQHAPAPPAPPSGRVVLPPPPELPVHDGAAGVLGNAVPMLGGLGSVVLVATMGGSPSGLRILAAGLFLVATLGFVVVQIDRQRTQRTQQVDGARTDHLDQLAAVRTQARAAARQQRAAAAWHHPAPAALPGLAAEGSRVWERAPGTAEFLRVRYGTTVQPASLALVASDAARPTRADPVARAAQQRLLAVHRTVPDVPVTLDLAAHPRVDLVGDPEDTRAAARALLCSAAAFHAPGTLAVAVLADAATLAHWDWAKWLPHGHRRDRDAAGPRRTVLTGPDVADDLAALVEGEVATDGPPHLLVVVDRAPGQDRDAELRRALPPGGATLVRLRDPAEQRGGPGTRLVVAPAGSPAAPGRPTVDRCDPATAEALARRLLPRRAPSAAAGHRTGPTGPVDLGGLLALGDLATLAPATSWRARRGRDRLRVPIGTAEDASGGAVHLDLKESAHGGMGPHGLVVGATGSGKSELLRTLVLGLAATHPPEELNLVLVDFKGGATFAGLGGLPHVSAVITNLAEELALVERMQDALEGELTRRQQLLRRAGNHASRHDYEQARAAGADLAPLPSLLVVVDEFSELLAARPDFLDLFVAIGRLGRSLGLHLLLASQRVEEGRLRGLESHLSYRIGLRTFSAQESRAVLGVPDAHELPATPGLGYLKPDPATLVRFRAAYVSGPAGTASPGPTTAPPAVVPFTVTEVAGPRTVAPRPDSPAPEQPTTLEVVLGRLRGHGAPAHRVWLPPLDAPATLGDLLGELVADPDLGLVAPRWRARPGLAVPLGLLDRPREQRRDPLVIDLAGADGHLAVVGAPRTGKSTALRTVVSALALTTTPQEARFFVLDLGGGALAPLAGLPHVAGVATRGEPAAVRRAVAQVGAVLARREAYFREEGIDSIETYRDRRAAGAADDGYGDVFVVLDGWGTLRAELDDLEPALQQLAVRGPAFGVHLLASAVRWSDFRTSVRDVLGTRLELRLGDPVESEVDRRAQALVPRDRPGRGLAPGPVHLLTALPRVDDGAADLAAGTADLVARVRAAWDGPDGPALQLLPVRVPLAAVRRASGAGDETGPHAPLLLGLRETDLAPLRLPVAEEPHLLVLGESGSGRTALLRTYLHEVVRTRSPRQAQVVVIDPRRSLLGEVPEAHLLHHLGSPAQVRPALTDLVAHLQTRLPGPEVSAAQLRGRSWWSGAEVFVVVDDQDLLPGGHACGLEVLQPLLAQARDVGLHLMLARRSGGAARALHEPVAQTLRDLGSPGLLLSAGAEDGPLLGLRPAPSAPGRGRLVTRAGVEVVQVAWQEPAP